ncbi:hypothetical protein THRCLA_20602 [Thraustotheca clavata]|uniref:Protein kinase domain-containing protein n=1 Tax=Thraustotheca clavata TaxID=74557 RepID=A0A1W0A5E5_9STRA|nr:hypothetical protein THRCLA_20602 [Thraustotheca clavata]
MRQLEMYYIPPNHLDTLRVIAQGAFGKVFLGNYLGKAVAIKTLITEARDIKQLQIFIDEISLVAKLSSPYIVQFKGASWTTPADIVLVTEFMDGGDLRTALEFNSDRSFKWENKVACALDIVDALGYLHTLEHKVVHRDLKSRNVLLNSQMRAKVTDFGVSKETDDKTMTTGIGTFRWMAPEVLLDNHYTESADMYSFGVILAELSTEIVPYSDLTNHSGLPYTDTAIMTLVMKGYLSPTFGPDTPQWFYELGLKCLSINPEDRPNALEASHSQWQCRQLNIQFHLELLKVMAFMENDPKWNPEFKKRGMTTITAYRFIPDVALFCGRSDGKLLRWCDAPNSRLLPHGDHFGGHSGTVMVLEYLQRAGSSGILFSGSVDRTIKLWDTSSSSALEAGCVQTLNAHGGTITMLNLAGNTLVSGSIDRTIKLWTPDKDRALLRHPWYVCVQTLSTAGSWPTCSCLRLGDVTSIYVGDSAGGLSIYTASNRYLDRNNENGNGQMKLKRLFSNFHALGIIQVLVIPDQNLIVTLGYDDKTHISDATSGIITITMDNSKYHRRYRSCDWDKAHRELYLIDEGGYLSIWSMDSEKCKKTERVATSSNIFGLSVWCGGSFMMIQTPGNGFKFKIKRDATYMECKGHTDAVIAVAAIMPTSEDHIASSGTSIFSASIDNTLRCWDPYDVHVLYGFEEKESELSCLAYAPKYNRLLTGSENGNFKQWNVDNGQYSIIPRHKNTISCITVATGDDHEYVITGDYDGVIWIWEMASAAPPTPHFKIQIKERTKPCEIYCTAFNDGAYLLSPRSEYIAVGDSHGDIMLYGLEDQKLYITLSNHEEAVTCLIFDGCFLFSGSEDCTIKIWNAINPHSTYEVGFIKAHNLPIRDLLIMPVTGYVVTCAYDGRIRVWNYQECGSDGSYAKMVHEFRKSEGLHCLAYWPQRCALVCGTKEANVLVFEIPKHLVTPGCGISKFHS